MSAAGVNPEPGPDGGQADSGAGPGDESAAAVADAHRREWAFVLAATARVTRDLDVAEESVQEAYVSALRGWEADGVPANPGAPGCVAISSILSAESEPPTLMPFTGHGG